MVSAPPYSTALCADHNAVDQMDDGAALTREAAKKSGRHATWRTTEVDGRESAIFTLQRLCERRRSAVCDVITCGAQQLPHRSDAKGRATEKPQRMAEDIEEAELLRLRVATLQFPDITAEATAAAPSSPMELSAKHSRCASDEDAVERDREREGEPTQFDAADS